MRIIFKGIGLFGAGAKTPRNFKITDMKNAKKIKRVEIFDLDGTVVDSSSRVRSLVNESGKKVLDLAHWKKHQHECYKDSLLPLAKHYKHVLQLESVLCVVATNRLMLQEDFNFLNGHLGKPDAIVHRVHDQQSGKMLKLTGIERILSELDLIGKPLKVYEDNIDLLKHLCDNLTNCTGIYVPSKQGF